MNTDQPGFPQMPVRRRTGRECFRQGAAVLPFTVLDFWQWAASDLVSNTARGILAEFIVAQALGLGAGVRHEWDAFDLVTKEGFKVEVKSAAYLQAWHHAKLSRICFGIGSTKGWDAATGTFGATAQRQADVYVFCLLHHRDKATLDPLDLNQWTFYILPAAALNTHCPKQKTIGLATLEKLKPTVATYEQIAAGVRTAAAPVPIRLHGPGP